MRYVQLIMTTVLLICGMLFVFSAIGPGGEARRGSDAIEMIAIIAVLLLFGAGEYRLYLRAKSDLIEANRLLHYLALVAALPAIVLTTLLIVWMLHLKFGIWWDWAPTILLVAFGLVWVAIFLRYILLRRVRRNK
ncbi:MAG TPA: hypothetical protein VEA80_02250 [Vitreimonas sp.]|uniref:hypothetical protein n=1 Tax=Vitreimonas sp. TaxID=3069702 RepID=UPI002D3327AF|nr:hypothetical protein [Vitreimonas sp.]HYD86272.1 hypothetical protein [Vitreimonas sp.]